MMPQQRRNAARTNQTQTVVLRQYLMHLMDYFESYHQSKENMSWLVTTIYLGALIALASVLSRSNAGTTSTANPWIRGGFIGLAVLTLVFVLKFLWQQTSDRRVAARFVSACGTLLSRSLAMEIHDADLVEDRYCTIGAEHLVPTILARQLRESTGQGRFFDWYILSPTIVILLWTAGFVLFALLVK